MVKKTGHLHQCDLASLIPLELFTLAKLWPQTTTNETYLLMSQLMLSFFDRLGFSQPDSNSKFTEVNQTISRMHAEWLSFDIRCS